MKYPITIEDAEERGLLVKEGIHTFSNGTEWEGWAEGNCLACWFYDKDCAGARCAFEGAALLGMVSPPLAQMFGWKRDEIGAANWSVKHKEPDDPRSWWMQPSQCAFFHERPKGDDGDDDFDIEPPPPPDPNQLVLIADPTEDAAAFSTSPTPAREPAEVVV